MMTDAFFVAFKIPNLLRRMFAEGAFSQAFVPILAEYKNRLGHDATKTWSTRCALRSRWCWSSSRCSASLARLGWPISARRGFGPMPKNSQLTVTLLRITFPYIVFISLVALAAGILNTYSKFSVPAFAPVLLNVAMIAAALWLAPYVRSAGAGAGLGRGAGRRAATGVDAAASAEKLDLLPRPTLQLQRPRRASAS